MSQAYQTRGFFQLFWMPIGLNQGNDFAPLHESAIFSST